MKSTTLSFLLILCLSAQSQSACSKVTLLDHAVMLSPGLPLHKLKEISEKEVSPITFVKVKANIIKAASPAFFAKLEIKKIVQYDSAFTSKNPAYPSVFDKEGNTIDFLYIILYEMVFEGNKHFVFQAVFTRNGELVNDDDIVQISKVKKIISCEKAVAITQHDPEAGIKLAGDIILYYDVNDKAIIWEILENVSRDADFQNMIWINAVDGKILRRDKIDKGIRFE